MGLFVSGEMVCRDIVQSVSVNVLGCPNKQFDRFEVLESSHDVATEAFVLVYARQGRVSANAFGCCIPNMSSFES